MKNNAMKLGSSIVWMYLSINFASYLAIIVFLKSEIFDFLNLRATLYLMALYNIKNV